LESAAEVTQAGPGSGESAADRIAKEEIALLESEDAKAADEAAESSAEAALSSAPAAEYFAFSPEVADSLLSNKVNDRDTAIGALVSDYSSGAEEVLAALLSGNLYANKESKSFYIRDSAGVNYLSLSTGETLPGEGLSVRKVGINNKQREALVGIINGRSLKNPDLKVRRAASRSLVSSDALDAALIGELLESETDPETRLNFEKALAVSVLKNNSSSKDELVGALGFLRSQLAPEARELIRSKLSDPDPMVAKAAEAALATMEARVQHLALFETIFFGLSLGSVLVLIGIGLSITFGVMGVINMAHGEMVMLGAYSVWFLQTILPGRPGLALILAIPAAFLLTGLVGGIIERGVIRFLYKRPLETLLATFGISLILQQTVRTFISTNNRPVETPAFMSGQWYWTEHFSVTYGRFYIILFCLAVFFMIYLIMQKTRLGLEVRAVTQNRAMARAMGVNSSWVDTMTFCLGSGVAGMAGVALSQLTNVGPNLGQNYIVDSFMVVVFGGVGNLWGTLTGGLIIGMANKFLEPLNGAILAKIIIMVGVILFIQRHPSGLFPQKGRATVL
jgi:urea transport system permease protein